MGGTSPHSGKKMKDVGKNRNKKEDKTELDCKQHIDGI